MHRLLRIAFVSITAPWIVSCNNNLTFAFFVEISAGNLATCGIRQNGTLECWGDDQQEILGDGLDAQRIPTECSNLPQGSVDFFRCVPAPVAGGRLYSAVSVGGSHACAIERVSNQLYCWGDNFFGQLGFATPSRLLSTPTRVNGPTGAPLTVRSVSSGAAHTCALSTANQVLCWGDNSQGQLGTPGPVNLGSFHTWPGSGYQDVTSGGLFTCVLGGTRMVTCHGIRAAAPALNVDVTSLSQGALASHACAPASAPADLWCWGIGERGQLGIGAGGTNVSSAAVQVTSGGGTPLVAEVATTGEFHTCALSYRLAFCWGGNTHGQLGIGIFAERRSPELVTSVPDPSGTSFVVPYYTRISAGSNHTCAITDTRRLFCWGLNTRGQLGVGSTNPPSNVPTALQPWGIPRPTTVTRS
jgi:alpha-tubulin suppressor-like RCC1 family protein